MKLLLRLSALVMVAICATWAYRVNYATQEAMNRVADLEDAIAAEREAMAVLNAEWAYLNRPDRLRTLVAENAATLGLAELTPDSFGTVAMVAFPPEPEAPEAVAEAEGAGEAASDPKAAVRPRPAEAKVAAPNPAPNPTAKPVPKPTAKPTARPAGTAAPKSAPAAAPRREVVVAAEPRRPRTLQDLVNAVAAGVKP